MLVSPVKLFYFGHRGSEWKHHSDSLVNFATTSIANKLIPVKGAIPDTLNELTPRSGLSVSPSDLMA